MNNQNKTISSSEIGFDERQTLRKEYRKRPRVYPFTLATLYGNCCWKIWSRYHGGRPFPMATPDVYEPGWRIKAVELVKNCNLI